jgi:hypothetical protein
MNGSRMMKNAPNDEEDFEQLFLADVAEDDIEPNSVDSLGSTNSRWEPEGETVEALKNDDEWALLMESSKAIEDALINFSSGIKERGTNYQDPSLYGELSNKPQSAGKVVPGGDFSGPLSSDNNTHNFDIAGNEIEYKAERVHTIVRELLSEMVFSVACVCSVHYAPQTLAGNDSFADTAVEFSKPDHLPLLLEDDYAYAPVATATNEVTEPPLRFPLPFELDREFRNIELREAHVKVGLMSYF